MDREGEMRDGGICNNNDGMTVPDLSRLFNCFIGLALFHLRRWFFKVNAIQLIESVHLQPSQTSTRANTKEDLFIISWCG